MKFGKSAEEAAVEPSRGGGGNSTFMKYLRDGDNEIHVVDEPDQWIYYWEHYSPATGSFPCTNDRDTCPGCTSDDEQLRKSSRKVAFNVLGTYEGKQYLDVWKFPKTVSDKLKTRYERLGTITDRPYIITRYKKDNNFYDYDVEGQDKTEPVYDKDQLGDVEEFLAAAYDEVWGDSTKVKATTAKVKQGAKETALQEQINEARSTVKPAVKKAEPKPEPEEKEVTEEELRAMDFWALVKFCEDNGFGKPKGDDVNEIVDWLLQDA